MNSDPRTPIDHRESQIEMVDAPSGRRGHHAVGLVERHREFQALQGLFARCRQGHGQIVLITGGVASGKTQLLNDFADTLSTGGVTVLTATAARAEQTLQLGIMDQLIRQIPFSENFPRNIRRVLDEHSSVSGTEPDRRPASPPHPQVMRVLSTALLDLSVEGPVVIGVDDVHFADSQSLQILLYLQRRMRSASILMVLTEWAQPRPRRLPLHTEIARLPYFSRIRLARLSLAGVSELLAQHVDTATARHLAAAYYQTSGGNPLLVHALIEDYLSTEHSAPSEVRAAPAVGEAFAQAVLACLHRWEVPLFHVARGVALLGEHATPHRLGRLLGMTADSAAQALDVLTMAGVTEDGGFRHPSARAAVLRDLAPDERSALHVRAAELLYQDGRSVTTVAGHLLAADRADDRWAVGVLRDAAELALDEDEETLASACLELAQRECTDERERATITELLARAEWRSRPATAGLRIQGLTKALREGHLPERGALTLVKYLLWHGRADEAANTLRALLDRSATGGDRMDLQLTYLLLSFSHPPYFPPHPSVAPGVVGDGALPPAEEPWRRAAAALGAVLTHGPIDTAVGAAEHVLQTCAMTDRTLDTLLCALLSLVYAERCDRAAGLCDALLDEAEERRAPTWRTQLHIVRADIAMRLGDPLLAVEHARTALDRLNAKQGDIGVGAPLSTLILATTAMGDLGEAAALLKRPVPDEMFRTWFGPPYLYARGQYFLAADRPATALSDFHQCGDLMRRWNIDHPAVAPWRSGVAQVQLLLGRPDQARQSVADQLALRGTGPRTKGISLRLLAQASPPEGRMRRLEEAVELLRDCGDRLELATTLGALADAGHTHGESTKARTALGQAVDLARSCHASTLHQQLVSSARRQGGRGGVPREQESNAGIASLSKAERRVASLAGLGHTNRAISRKLGITISTVEQHLTRVYRKLNVQSRADLPVGLPLHPVPDSARGERGREHGWITPPLPHRPSAASN